MGGLLGNRQAQRVEFNPEIIRQAEAFEARRDHNGDIATILDRDSGSYIMAEPRDPGDTIASTEAAEQVQNQLGFFRTEDIGGSMHDALSAANRHLEGSDSGVSIGALQFFHERRSRRLDGVYGAIGAVAIYRYRTKGIFRKRVGVDPVTTLPRNEDHFLDGEMSALPNIEKGALKVKPGDRFVMVSRNVAHQGEAGIVASREAAADPDPASAAERLVADGPAERDRVALLVQIERRRRRLGGLLGGLATEGTVAGGGAAGGSRSGATQGRHSRRSWFRGAGAAGIGLAAGATAANAGGRRRPRFRDYVADMRGNNARYRQEHAADWEQYNGKSPHHWARRRALGAAALGGAAYMALTRNRRDRWNDYYRNDPYYGPDSGRTWTDEEIAADIRERRRARGLAAVGIGVLAAVGVGALAQKLGILDLSWSNRDVQFNNDPIVAHINMSHDSVLPDWEPPFMDGDGFSGPDWYARLMHKLFGWDGAKHVTFIPWHLPGQHVAPVAVPNNVNPDQWMHNYLQQHPAAGGPNYVPQAPVSHTPADNGIGQGSGGAGGGLAAGTHHPSAGNGSGAGSGGGAGTGAEGAPAGNGEEIYVEPGSGFIREIEEYRASTGRPVSAGHAFQLYQDARHDFGDSGLINGKGTYIFQNGTPGGDLRISSSGDAYLTNQFEQYLDQAA